MRDEPWKGLANIKEGENFPATYIDHSSAEEFCRRFSAQEHRAGRLPQDWEYRLPTEARWEYARRAETTTKYSFGDDASD